MSASAANENDQRKYNRAVKIWHDDMKHQIKIRQIAQFLIVNNSIELWKLLQQPSPSDDDLLEALVLLGSESFPYMGIAVDCAREVVVSALEHHQADENIRNSSERERLFAERKAWLEDMVEALREMYPE